MNNIISSNFNSNFNFNFKSLVLFSNQFKSSNWPPLFVINLKNWYLSKTISFLKCPFVPTFLLIIARRCDQKNGNVFSQGPICLGVFCPHFKSDIHKHNKRVFTEIKQKIKSETSISGKHTKTNLPSLNFESASESKI